MKIRVTLPQTKEPQKLGETPELSLRQGLPGEHGSADTSISNNKFLLFKPLDVWSVVTAALTN